MTQGTPEGSPPLGPARPSPAPTLPLRHSHPPSGQCHTLGGLHRGGGQSTLGTWPSTRRQEPGEPGRGHGPRQPGVPSQPPWKPTGSSGLTPERWAGIPGAEGHSSSGWDALA